MKELRFVESLSMSVTLGIILSPTHMAAVVDAFTLYGRPVLNIRGAYGLKLYNNHIHFIIFI